MKDVLSQLANLLMVMEEERRTYNSPTVILAIETAIRVIQERERYALHIEMSNPEYWRDK